MLSAMRNHPVTRIYNSPRQAGTARIFEEGAATRDGVLRGKGIITAKIVVLGLDNTSTSQRGPGLVGA